MNYKLTVDDIRRVVDQHKDYKISITTDGLGAYVARIANTQAIEVAKVLLAENDRLQQDRDKLIEVLRWYGRDEQYTIPHVGCSPRVNADRGQRARDILKEIGVNGE